MYKLFSLYIILQFCIPFVSSQEIKTEEVNSLPNGTEFNSWERPLHFSKTYYVNAATGNDNNPGNESKPFKTINKAAKILTAGERVVIFSGVYRECVQPIRGGSSPEQMISYEAAPGAKVVIKGSIEVPNEMWNKSTGWYIPNNKDGSEPKIYELKMDGDWFGGYNPFGMVNVLNDRYWLNYKEYKMAPYFRRRAMVFVDGNPLEQVDLFNELGDNAARSLSVYSDVYSQPLFTEFGGVNGKFWIEHNGQTIHIRLTGDDDPKNHSIEITTREQAFAPASYHLGYIRIKGLMFEHAGNGFPVPQRGLVSTSRGHHWIIEDNTIQWANSVGLDVGNEDWNATQSDTMGYDIIRGNRIRYCGIEGIGGPGTSNLLVEQNLFEWIGWQDAAEMAECAAMKLHFAKNLMFQHNVIRHTRYADGVWLDINNINCRLTGNIFADIGGENCKADNGRTGVHIEGSVKVNLVDNNIFYNAFPGIKIRDTDSLWIVNNLFANCPIAITSVRGLAIHSTKVENRPIMGFAAPVRDNKVINNVFVSCSKSAIEFNNVNNYAEGNIYANMPQIGSYLRILSSEPQEWLDLTTWQAYYGWDKNGATADIHFMIDPDKLTFSMTSQNEITKVSPFLKIKNDFFNHRVDFKRFPGPFIDLDLTGKVIHLSTIKL